MSPETRLNLYYQIKLRVYIIIIMHLHTHAYSLVPRPFPPPVFHCFQYESDEILAVGTAWERGYTCTLTPSPHAPRRLDNGVVYALFSHQVSYSDELASTRGRSCTSWSARAGLISGGGQRRGEKGYIPCTHLGTNERHTVIL